MDAKRELDELLSLARLACEKGLIYDTLVSIKEASKILGLSPNTIYFLIRSGQLACVRPDKDRDKRIAERKVGKSTRLSKPSGGRVLLRRKDLQHWVNTHYCPALSAEETP